MSNYNRRIKILATGEIVEARVAVLKKGLKGYLPIPVDYSNPIQIYSANEVEELPPISDTNVGKMQKELDGNFNYRVAEKANEFNKKYYGVEPPIFPPISKTETTETGDLSERIGQVVDRFPQTMSALYVEKSISTIRENVISDILALITEEKIGILNEVKDEYFELLDIVNFIDNLIKQLEGEK